MLNQGPHCIFILVYVDDTIVTGDSLCLIQDFIDKLHSEFAQQFGSINYFLGIQVQPLPDGFTSHMTTAKGISTPMVTNLKLSKHRVDCMINSTLYRSTVGALYYVIITIYKA